MSMKKLVLVLAACAAAAWAQPGFMAPKAGCLVDDAGALRFVMGVRGNFVVGDAVMAGVESAACSTTSGLVKTGDALVTLDAAGNETGRQAAARGPVLFAFSPSGAPAYAYIVAARQLFRWTGEGWGDAAGSWDGETLAIAAPDGGGLLALVRLDAAVWLYRISAAGVVVPLRRVGTGGNPEAVFGDGSVLSVADRSLELEDSNGVATAFAMPAPVQRLTTMGAGWLRGSADGLDFAVALDGGALKTWFLPKPRPVERMRRGHAGEDRE